jgi:hypothetical protein
MRNGMIAVGCLLAAASTVPAWSQSAPAAAGANCYIEVGKLVTSEGIEELNAAVRQIDERLRPQVEQINFLRQEIARVEAPAVPGVQLASDSATDEFGRPRARLSAEGADPLAERLQRRMDLDAMQAQLRLAYAEQMRAVMGPIQQQVGARATAFGTQRGCSALKMARSVDMAGLRNDGARDLTSEFVTWYAANKG